MRSASATGQPPADHKNRILEVIAVLLLGMATVGSAWCAYQATQWNGEESRLSRVSLGARVEASRLYGLATQIISYDSSLVSDYAQAVATGNEPLKTFYRETLVRPAFLPILDAWEAQVAAGGGSPPNLFENEEYIDAQLVEYRAAEAKADVGTVASEQANDYADQYVMTTLILASALFFAGVTTSFRLRFARIVLLAGSIVLIGYAASRIVDLPVL